METTKTSVYISPLSSRTLHSRLEEESSSTTEQNAAINQFHCITDDDSTAEDSMGLMQLFGEDSTAEDSMGLTLLFCEDFPAESDSWLEEERWSDSNHNAAINQFDRISDDILGCILSKLISTGGLPADFITAIMTCKRFRHIGMLPTVLCNAPESAFAVRPVGFSEASPSHGFLRKCAESGNMDASYTLGMMEFYGLKKWEEGASLIENAANAWHSDALYSLAVIRFNGSGGNKKDIDAGVALCKKAALVGHIGAMRELSECYRRGFGVDRSEKEAIRFQQDADSMEIKDLAERKCKMPCRKREFDLCTEVPYSAIKEEFERALKTKDFECSEHPLRSHEKHVAMDFLRKWYMYQWPRGLRSCRCCTRMETRKDEFRCCSHCRLVNYCSFNCELFDLKYIRNGDCFHSCGLKFSVV